MDFHSRPALRGLALLLAVIAPASAQADVVQTDHVEAELVAERTALVRGADNWLALRLKPESGWHTYWRNPGDSGIPTRLSWALPRGISAGEIVWPLPERHLLGEITNYGYGTETLHLIPLTIAPDVRTGEAVELKAEAKWLVCNPEICIPGDADLRLKTTVAAQASPQKRWQDAFARSRASVPVPVDWPASFATDQKDFSLMVTSPELERAAEIEFFPYAKDLVNHSVAPRRVHAAKEFRVSQVLSAYFLSAPPKVEGALVVSSGDTRRAYEIAATPGPVTAVVAGAPSAAAKPGTGASPGLLLALALALAGGLILNLMPCVFPVLALKALAVLEARDGRERAQAISYTAGVVVSFAIVAGALLALRAAGEVLGWGFQLQSPVFVGALAYLFFAMGLALSGVAEIGTRFMGLGQSLTQSGGLAGSFFTGVLAAVVASPCVAPFMGTALGYAVTQPAPVALLVFATLGLGLALPFLLMGLFPQLARWLPKPGRWMETFRELMAFPLYLTVVWLLWVLARQSGPDATALVAVGLVSIALALWMRRLTSSVARAGQWLMLAAALALLAHPAVRTAAEGPKAAAAHAAEAYSEERLVQLRSEKRTVFVNFTADWCLTCKVNERAVLSRESVRRMFAQRRVAELVGDWTRPDPVITQALERFGRSGVPLYLVYRDGGEPQVLPQILTPEILMEALGAPKE